MTSSFDAGVMDKLAFIGRARKWARSSIVDVAGEAVERGLKSTENSVRGIVTSDNIGDLVRNTIHKSWKPILGVSAGVGLMATLGSQVGKRLIPNPPPAIADPSVMYANSRYAPMMPPTGAPNR